MVLKIEIFSLRQATVSSFYHFIELEILGILEFRLKKKIWKNIVQVLKCRCKEESSWKRLFNVCTYVFI